MVINPDKKFLFIHIPKSAGSSLTQALMRIPGSSKGPFTYPHYTVEDYKKFFSGKYNIDEFMIFGIIRNPWARLFSWYIFNQGRYRSRPGRYTDQPAFKEKQFEVPFNEWLLTKEFITSEEFKFNENPIPAQKRSQFDWLNGSPENIDYIFTVENISEMGTMLEREGIIDSKRNFIIPNSNVTNAGRRYREIYSEEARKWVEKYFKKDIEFGQYGF